MIYTCTLNPAIDLFVDVDYLEPNVVNRTNSEDYQPNGKSINISILLKQMGINNTAIGFIGGFTGKYIENELQQLGIVTDFIEIEGITRINTFVRTNEKEYKIVNKGPSIPNIKKDEILKKLECIPKESILFVSGSLPKGISEEIYIDIAKISKQNSLKLILDISSVKLLDCLPYHPYLIKPNQEELANLFNMDTVNKEQAFELGKQLLKQGAERVLVSLGEDGALFISDEETIKVTTPKGKVVNTACAGDALLASFIGKLTLGSSIEEALIFASATGASTAFSKGLSDLTDVKQLMSQITVSHLCVNKEG
ncbi:1-phosphofructokinase [Metabacillus sp. Hm71]|uniref:1-phosphofructokinase n=1 Tax=Metabacillus sp. Hm71 TaxID=3450743 RepID=UPI003F43B74C